MALSITDVQKLYIALFNRPADTAGLAYWVSQADLSVAARAFTASTEYTATHASLSNSQIVTSFYQNLFGRTPEPSGLAYWLNLLTIGTLDAGNLANTMAHSAAGTDITVMTNKAAVAASFTTSLDTPVKQQAYNANSSAAVVKTLLNSVTTDPATLTVAQNAIPSTIDTLMGVVTAPSGPSSDPAQTFILTAATDTFTGGSANDTFNGTSTTYNATDVLNGGAGNDTLALATSGDITLNGANLSSIERLKVTATGSSTIVSLAAVSGMSELINDSSTTDVTFGATGAGVNQLANLTINAATGNTTVKFNGSALTGNADAMSLTLTGYGSLASSKVVTLGAVTATSNELETLNIVTSGSNGISLVTDGSQTSLTTLNLTGSGSLLLALGSSANTITTINAASASANLVVGSLGAGSQSVTLGSGNDIIGFGTNLDATDTVNGGAGTDILLSSKALAAADLTNVSNIEALGFDTGSGSITQNASLVSGYNFAMSGSGNLTLNNLVNNASTTILGSVGSLSQTLAVPGGTSDTLSLILGGDNWASTSTLAGLNNVAGLETLNIVSGGVGGNTISGDFVSAKHVISGSANLTIGNSLSVTSIDASALTGNLSINTSPVTQTIIAGSGNDLIQLGFAGVNTATGADVITLGAGNDTVRFLGNASYTGGVGTGSLTDFSTLLKITDFHVGATGSSDLLGFSSSDADFGLYTNNGVGIFTTGLAKGAIAQGLAASDAMVVQNLDVNASAVTATANASFIKLRTAVAMSVDIKNTFANALGSASITGLAANGNYLMSVYDTTHSQMILALVNTGNNADGDTTLAANDMVNSGIAVLGVLAMTAADYAAFSASNLANAL